MNNRPARINSTTDGLMKYETALCVKIVDLQKKVDKYEKALFVIGEIAVCSFESTIVGIVDSFNVSKLSKEAIDKYLKEFKGQKDETNN